MYVYARIVTLYRRANIEVQQHLKETWEETRPKFFVDSMRVNVNKLSVLNSLWRRHGVHHTT